MIEEKYLELPYEIWDLLSEKASDIHHAKHPNIMEEYTLAESTNNKDKAQQILIDHFEKSFDGIKICGYKIAKEIDIDYAEKEIRKLLEAPRETIMETLKQVIKIDENSLQKIHDMMYCENYDMTLLVPVQERDGSHTLLIFIFAVE